MKKKSYIIVDKYKPDTSIQKMVNTIFNKLGYVPKKINGKKRIPQDN